MQGNSQRDDLMALLAECARDFEECARRGGGGGHHACTEMARKWLERRPERKRNIGRRRARAPSSIMSPNLSLVPVAT